MDNAAASLEAYAAERIDGGYCIVCHAPDDIRRQLEAMKGKPGITYKLMGEWLRDECGIPKATKGKLERHWHQNHHLDMGMDDV
jgi:hypothetical protein